ncbi:CvpA family protein [uncultured Campylobacter sp.]|uniref:CvpA family protein n=1 Tax=uncultured Campylobacter sp. TaxID=218934 RepID=UPI002616F24A|nr:CvpA family protein [uncultured Campylobacter sp.]
MGANWLDIIVLALILIFGLKGLKSGMVREIFGIAGLIGGLYFAIRYKSGAGAWIDQNIYSLDRINIVGGDGTQVAVGFLALLFSIWIICLILGEILAKLFSLSGISFVDRIGGFLLSGSKIFLILSVFAALIKTSAFLNETTRPYFKDSLIFPYLLSTGQKIMDIDYTTIKESIENVNNGAKKLEKVMVIEDEDSDDNTTN